MDTYGWVLPGLPWNVILESQWDVGSGVTMESTSQSFLLGMAAAYVHQGDDCSRLKVMTGRCLGNITTMACALR